VSMTVADQIFSVNLTVQALINKLTSLLSALEQEMADFGDQIHVNRQACIWSCTCENLHA